MKKGRGAEKKPPRVRNLKGLSIFDDEIAAPSEYGDFMKIDAPVALRVAKEIEKTAPSIANPPHWEKFIGGDGTEKAPEPIQKAASNDPTDSQTVQNIESQASQTILKEEAIAPSVKEEVLQKALEVSDAQTTVNPILKSETGIEKKETTHKLPTEQREANPKIRRDTLVNIAQPRIQLKTNEYQRITPNFGFGSLVGVQRRIVLFIFEDCLRGGRSETTPLTVDHLCHTLTLTPKTLKGSIYRLLKKQFVEVAASKEGRGGWIIYRLNREIYSELLLLNNNNQLLERDIGIGAIPNESIDAHTNQVEEKKPNNSEYENIDFSELQSIGFSKYHLNQLAIQKNNRLSIQELQDSINFFAFDLKKNNKRTEIKGDPINYFMGIVRNGRPYTPPSNYISADDESRNKYLEYLKQKENERLAQEQKIKEIEFFNWKSSGDLKEAIDAAPEMAKNKPGPMLDFHLEDYFDKNIWPNVKAKFSKPTPEEITIREQVRRSLEGRSE